MELISASFPACAEEHLTMDGEFQLPMVFNLGATFFFALTGALAALRRHYDFVGFFAISLVTGVGGGLIRDGIFIQNGPPLVVRDSRYLIVICAACVLVLVFGRLVNRFQGVFEMLDAVGLAAFSVVGAQLALEAHLSAAAALLVGVINSCGGGLLRDILIREEPLMFKPGQFYALAALLGSTLFVALVLRGRIESSVAGLISVSATFIFRTLTIRFNWRTSPVRRGADEKL